jgi:TRAP-type C4-dicarboxylate transport system permease small subunit
MRRTLRIVLKGLAIIAVSLPLGVMATFVLLPFWRWLERTTGIESIGHSGPAGWCYLVGVAAAVLTIAAFVVVNGQWLRPPGADDEP